MSAAAVDASASAPSAPKDPVADARAARCCDAPAAPALGFGEEEELGARAFPAGEEGADPFHWDGAFW